TTLLTALRTEDGAGANVFTFTPGAGGAPTNFTIRIGINGGATANITILESETAAMTVGGLIDRINDNSLLKGNLRAEFDEATSRISLVAVDPTIESIEFSARVSDLNDAAATFAFNLGFGTVGNVSASQTVANTPVTSNVESMLLSTAEPEA